MPHGRKSKTAVSAFPLPACFIAGLDLGAGARDIEHVAAALLRLKRTTLVEKLKQQEQKDLLEKKNQDAIQQKDQK